MTVVQRFTVLSVGLTLLLSLAACGGGGSTADQPGQPTVNRNQLRATVIDGNGKEITSAVRNVIDFGRDSDRVAHTWNGDDLSATIFGSTPSDTVSLNSGANAVLPSSPMDSPVRGVGFSRREFDIGKTSDGRHTIGIYGVDWAKNDVLDHFAYGYWLTVSPFDDRPSVVDTGVFVNGPEFETPPALPTIGTASYEGRTSGLHTVNYTGGQFSSAPDDEFRIGKFEGDVYLTVFFKDMLVAGLIENITTIEEGTRNGSLHTYDRNTSRPFQVLLYDSSIMPDGSFSGGHVNVINTNPDLQQIAASHGSWEGRFSSRAVSPTDDSPRLAAGTFGTVFRFEDHDGRLGTEGQYIGTFSAEKQQ